MVMDGNLKLPNMEMIMSRYIAKMTATVRPSNNNRDEIIRHFHDHPPFTAGSEAVSYQVFVEDLNDNDAMARVTGLVSYACKEDMDDDGPARGLWKLGAPDGMYESTTGYLTYEDYDSGLFEQIGYIDAD